MAEYDPYRIAGAQLLDTTGTAAKNIWAGARDLPAKAALGFRYGGAATSSPTPQNARDRALSISTGARNKMYPAPPRGYGGQPVDNDFSFEARTAGLSPQADKNYWASRPVQSQLSPQEASVKSAEGQRLLQRAQDNMIARVASGNLTPEVSTFSGPGGTFPAVNSGGGSIAEREAERFAAFGGGAVSLDSYNHMDRWTQARINASNAAAKER